MTESLLELISNQLQLASRQAEQDRSAGSNPDHSHLGAQIEKLRIKIIEQRAELKIGVDGV